ncbi:DUF2254 domain-containing protein [Aquimarina muelleri]|uniref:DUF2254 domain-containing protein n=1 Tax=Aquimarina muelleri TaxID=279356 RepID=A0A918N549_9FLAO|nr:DUF2254 domain-containing protein [Aquimarina muelleri]MCX2764989.1 DUF2254 domain-containing protein [Aquimarina muelleri]GGX34857.1 hypothetical protein GCM10007384_39160 [Aquimarina muelleri]
MKAILKFLKKIKSTIFNSIAFYPVLISLAFFFLAIILLFIENLQITHSFKKQVPYLLVKNNETARTILSTLFGGILSLTVFSFTMVMVVLNQASSNFSPRLLPGLISDKKHQIILGFYIGTILYSIILLMSLGVYGASSNAIGFSVMISAILGIFCIGLFVYFIHSISQAIQIHNIINRIYHSSAKFLEKEKKEQNNSLYNIDTTDHFWKIIRSKKTGYYKSFDSRFIEDSLKNKDNIIEIIPYADQHVWEGDPVFKIKNPITDKELESLHICLYILSNRHHEDSSIGGMIKLTEVAVKALSPGINDPGTAINVISKLGQLLQHALIIKPKTIIKISDCKIKIIHNKISSKELMRIIIEPIRQYAKTDSSVSYELLDSLKHINSNTKIQSEYKQDVLKELKALCTDINENIKNSEDVNRILALLDN